MATSAPFMPIVPPPQHGEMVPNQLGYVPGFMDDWREDSGVDLDHFPMEQDDGNKNQMKIPDALDAIARQGKALWYDVNTQYYHVLDGAAFEKEFCALRITRGKKKDNGQSRPFASMSRQYVMVQGEKWAATGTVFKMKAQSGNSQKQPLQEDLHGTSSSDGTPDHYSNRQSSPSNDPPSRVMVQVRDKEGFFDTCTLQRFLEITGMDELYRRSLMESETGSKRPRNDGILINEEDIHRGLFGTTSGLPDASPAPDTNVAMRRADVEVVVSNLWSATSRGDQAYFFRRKAGVGAFSNGSIVRLVGGELASDEGVSEDGMYMVVSDLNAKWKGEPHPTPEEEREGHWCCFLGQVPITVAGPVKSGDHIGPRCDGTGFGRVVAGGEGAIVGIALDNKPSNGPGVVKTLCFAGLGALTQRSEEQYQEILKRMLSTELKLNKLEGSVQEVKQQVKAVKVDAEEHREQVLSLTDRVSNVEQLMVAKAVKELNRDLHHGGADSQHSERDTAVNAADGYANGLNGNGLNGNGLNGSGGNAWDKGVAGASGSQMPWDSFSNGGQRNMKLIAGACVCGVLLVVAILLGVLIGMRSGGGDSGPAGASGVDVSGSGAGGGSSSQGAGGQTGGTGTVEVAGVTWEVEVDVQLVGVSASLFMPLEAKFLSACSAVVGDLVPGMKVTNVDEYYTRRLGSAESLQRSSRRLQGVAVIVEMELYAFGTEEEATQVRERLKETEVQATLSQRVKEEVFEEALTAMELLAFRIELDGSSRGGGGRGGGGPRASGGGGGGVGSSEHSWS